MKALREPSTVVPTMRRSLLLRERLKIAGHTNPRGNEAPHEWLIQKLRTAINDNAVRTLGDRLLALKRARVDADYELASTRSFGSGTATYAVIQASDWIRDFGAIPVPRLQKVLRAGLSPSCSPCDRYSGGFRRVRPAFLVPKQQP